MPIPHTGNPEQIYKEDRDLYCLNLMMKKTLGSFERALIVCQSPQCRTSKKWTCSYHLCENVEARGDSKRRPPNKRSMFRAIRKMYVEVELSIQSS